jgi:hypothetical protein
MYLVLVLSYRIVYHPSFQVYLIFRSVMTVLRTVATGKCSTSVVSVYSGVALAVKELTYLQARCLEFHFISLEVWPAFSWVIKCSTTVIL